MLTCIFEKKLVVGIRRDDRRIKIYQVRVIDLVTLCTADTMWVMTGVARDILTGNVLVMVLKALVVQDAVAAVAAVAKRVVRRAFLRVI